MLIAGFLDVIYSSHWELNVIVVKIGIMIRLIIWGQRCMRVHNIGGGGGAGEICMQLLHLISIINVYQTLHRVQCMMHYRYTQWYTDYYIRGALLCLAIIGWGCKSTPAPPVPTPLSRAIINTDIHYQACACMLVFDCSNIFKYDIDVVGDHSTYTLKWKS